MDETLFKILVGSLLISLLVIITAIVVTIVKFANKHEKRINPDFSKNKTEKFYL